MYQLFKEECNANGIKHVSEKIYRDTFCTQYNLSFHKPKKDQCAKCHTYQEKERTGTSTEDDKVANTAHLDRKAKAREEKEHDKQVAKNDKSIHVVTFDLEAVLTTPCSLVSQIYYKRKLCSYNLSIYSLGDKKANCFLWDETHGKRGSCEICTCLFQYLNSLPQHVNHVILYSDTCTGQNRNQYITYALRHALNKIKHIKIIDQKFLETGHTQMECDSMHSAIEYAKKRTNIYVPSQWDTIMQMARRKNPYTVIPLLFSDIMDFKTSDSQTLRNTKVDFTGTRVNWLKLKWIRLMANEPDSMYLKYKFADEHFTELCFMRGKARVSKHPTQDVLPLYKEKCPISKEKKKDLVSLCESGIIPLEYREFYNNLPTAGKVRDCLPQPDCLEEEADTDNE